MDFSVWTSLFNRICVQVVDMGIVTEVMGELENSHITKEALEVSVVMHRLRIK